MPAPEPPKGSSGMPESGGSVRIATPQHDDSLRRQVYEATVGSVTRAFPEMGLAGSRSSEALHAEVLGPTPPLVQRLGTKDLRRFSLLRWLGTVGSVLIMIGGWGAGALPVVNNSLWDFPLAGLMGRMLLTSTGLVFLGIGCLVLAWAAMGFFALAGPNQRGHGWVTSPVMVRTFAAWVLPLAFTAPLFTQDIYSYIAQGAIAARGLDPYSGGPVDLLGVSDPLARSVPLVWSHSPSPYGPVAILIGKAISLITGDHIVAAVFCYRLVSIVGLSLCAWALVKLAHRCGVEPSASLWLGVLNPLSLLHLVGGIHNESIMLGLLLFGLEWSLRSLERSDHRPGATRRHVLFFVMGVTAISCATMVKVTAVIALAFVWIALVRRWQDRQWKWTRATVAVGGLTILVIILVSELSGLGLGWLFVQGGAADIVSWMSVTTLVGLAAGSLGGMLGLGDQTLAMTDFTHALGLVIAGLWMIRMLIAAYRGRMHPVGAYGVGMLILVLLFPVVHPWYALWAILPLSAWANRPLFRNTVVIYSVILSFFVLPRGLKLPPWTVVETYCVAAGGFVVLLLVLWVLLRIQESRSPSFSFRSE